MEIVLVNMLTVFPDFPTHDLLPVKYCGNMSSRFTTQYCVETFTIYHNYNIIPRTLGLDRQRDEIENCGFVIVMRINL